MKNTSDQERKNKRINFTESLTDPFRKFYEKFFSQEAIDRTISGGIKGQVNLLILSILLVFVIAIIIVTSFQISLVDDGDWKQQMWAIYYNFVDAGNQVEQEEWTNRLVVGIISMLGSILLGGILISTISNIIERRVETVSSGRAYYKNVKNHYVIVGYNYLVASLIKEIVQSHQDEIPYILVMSTKESEYIRHHLQTQLNQIEVSRLHIYCGNLDTLEDLLRLNIDTAKEVYILSEEENPGKDAVSIQYFSQVSQIRMRSDNRAVLPIFVQLDHPVSFSIIQKITIPEEFYKERTSGTAMPRVYFRPFNFYENWARYLWSIFTLDNEAPYDPLDFAHVMIPPAGEKIVQRQVHLVIMGFGRMGQALLLEALRVCHYPYYDDTVPEERRIRTLITVVDKDADDLSQEFNYFYPNINTQINDIKVEYRAENICSSSLRTDLSLWSSMPEQQLTVAVCISDPDISMHIGLNLPVEVYQSDARVLIRQEISTALSSRIVDHDSKCYSRVRVFGMMQQGLSKHIITDEMACYVNEDYLKSCQGEKGYIQSLSSCREEDATMFESKREEALMSWYALDESMRWANRYQIDAYLTYVRALGYDVVYKNPEELQAMSSFQKQELHSVREHFLQCMTDAQKLALERMEKYRWNAERTIEGYKSGAVRDNTYRIHHLIVPHFQLPDAEKGKDESVIMNLAYLLPLGNYYIVQRGSVDK